MKQNPDWTVVYAHELYTNPSAADILRKQASEQDFVYHIELQAYTIRRNSATHTLAILLGLRLDELYQYEY
jgi:hypothetical protein